MQVQQRRTTATAIYLNVYTNFPKLEFFSNTFLAIFSTIEKHRSEMGRC